MESILKFPDIKVNGESEKTLREGACSLVSKLRPAWPLHEFKYKIFTDGISNKLIGVYVKEDKTDMVLVRVYGQKTELIIDRTAEIRNMLVLNQVGCGCKLYAIFGNGLCYEYLPGDILTIESAKSESIYPLVAKAMAAMHRKVDLGKEIPKYPCMWNKMEMFLKQISDESLRRDKRLIDNDITVERLTKEVQLLKETLSKCCSPIVFTHNDLLLANIVVNDGIVYFIDYEYGDYNYQECDVANHFDEMSGVENMDFVKNHPSKEFQLDWIKHYLKEFNNEEEPSNAKIQDFYENVNKFSLCYHMMWGMWGLVQAQISKIEFDFVEFGLSRLLEYFRVKNERLQIK